MGLLWRQFTTLMWKSYLIRKRHYIATGFLLLVPLLLSLFYVWLYGQVSTRGAPGMVPDDTPRRPVLMPPTIYTAPTFDLFDSVPGDGVIFYAPENPQTAELMNTTRRIFNGLTISEFNFTAFANETLMFAEVDRMRFSDFNTTNATLYATLAFDDLNNPANFSYRISTIRSTPDANTIFRIKLNSAPERTRGAKYPLSFLATQIIVNEAYLNYRAARVNSAGAAFRLRQAGSNNARTPTSGFVMNRFPYPAYLDQNVQDQPNQFRNLTNMVIVSFILLFLTVVKEISQEKNNKEKELFSMMGLSDWVYYGSIFATYFLIFAVQAFIIVLMIFVGVQANTAKVLNFTSASLLYVVFLLFGANLLIFAMFLAIPISRPSLVGIASVIVYVGFMNAGPIIRDSFNDATTEKNPIAYGIAALFPTLGLNAAFELIGQAENLGDGVTYSNLFDYMFPYTRISLGQMMVIMFFSCILWSVLIWYLDNVWPWQAGVPKPVYFPFTRSYWSSKADETVYERTYKNPMYFEEEASQKRPAIELIKIKKKFGSKYVVKGVDLEIYRGEITVLLGHNGAGKTTTMSMMTGILPPTSGQLFVDGFNVMTQTKQARRSIGLCPQTNILYEDLTCEEHLILYAGIKGFPLKGMKDEVTNILDNVQLTEKRKVTSNNLSGGMKRKLNLGIAMVGGTKILVLDEPTSGLDPEARRRLWDVLLNIRKQRTILLTTHEMEEADALGDKLAIMDGGEIKCLGSSLFLKKAFGAGYTLHLAKARNFNISAVTAVIVENFPGATKASDIEGQAEFLLASAGEQVDTLKFPQFFKFLETKKDDLGIASFGVTVSTMEDVFLKVAAMSKVGSNESPPLSDLSDESADAATVPLQKSSRQNISAKRMTGCLLVMSQLHGLLSKRFNYLKRAGFVQLLAIFAPALVFFFLWVLIDRTLSRSFMQMPRTFKLGQAYGPNSQVFFKENSTFQSLLDYYRGAVETERGVLTALPTDANITNYLLGIGNRSLATYVRGHIIGLSVTSDDRGRIYDVQYSDEAFHAMPIAISMLYDALLAEIDGPNATITTTFVPLNREFVFFTGTINIIITTLLFMPMFSTSLSLYGSPYVSNPSQENTSQAKLVQLMTGLNPLVYWLSNFLFDLVILLLSLCTLFGVLLLQDSRRVFVGDERVLLAFFLIMLFAGITLIIIAYTASLYFSAETNGQIVLLQIYSYSTLVGGIVYYLLDFIRAFDITAATIHSYLGFLFRISPVFSAMWGSLKLYKSSALSRTCVDIPQAVLASVCNNTDTIFRPSRVGCCPGLCNQFAAIVAQASGSTTDLSDDFCFTAKNPFSFRDTGIMKELTNIIVVGIVFLGLLILFESLLGKKIYRSLRHWWTKKPALVAVIDDSDVMRERERVAQAIAVKDYSDTLLVQNLYKYFGKFTAVNHLSFGVHPRECFGVLGINGAGKSTTFKMVTGDILADEGNAHMGPNVNLENNIKPYQTKIGYCPQTNPLLDQLTGREMLYLMGRIRGIGSRDLKPIVHDLLKMVNVEEHADKRTSAYSGGNKRKLSLAMALVSAPELLILDEPTSGVDPDARRKIWTTLATVRQKYGCSIILTSHSMDECEALCARIGIMVKGQFRCLGGLQHLRNKFAQGFSLTVKLKRSRVDSGSDYVGQVVAAVQAAIPSAYVKDLHESLIYFHILDTNAKWSQMFEAMEAIKSRFDLEDYSLSDTTLEQIFISFAKAQEAESSKLKTV